MKKYGVIILLSLLAVCTADPAAGETERQRRQNKLMQAMGQYPDIVVSFSDHSISKKEVAEMVLRHHPDFEDYTYTELMDVINELIDDEIYYTLCADFLKKANFPPSQAETVRYLKSALDKFPPEMKKIKYKDKDIATLSTDRDLQFVVALQKYLKKNHPSQITVSDEEVEYFYRVNQNIFMRDAKLDIAFIATAKTDPQAFAIIRNASNMLKQGVLFSKLAADINKKLPEDFFGLQSLPPEIAEKASKMPVGEPSNILDFPEYFAIIQINRKQSPRYIPLQDAAFFIRTELESRKAGIYLEKLLINLINNAGIRRHEKN